MALSGRRPHPWKAAAGFHLGWIARPRKVSKDSPSASDQGQAGSGPAQRCGRRGLSYARPSYVTTSEAAGCRSGLSLKLADPTNAVADLCLERAHTGSSVAAGITGVKISAKPDLDRDMG